MKTTSTRAIEKSTKPGHAGIQGSLLSWQRFIQRVLPVLVLVLLHHFCPAARAQPLLWLQSTLRATAWADAPGFGQGVGTAPQFLQSQPRLEVHKMETQCGRRSSH